MRTQNDHVDTFIVEIDAIIILLTNMTICYDRMILMLLFVEAIIFNIL